MIYVTCAIIERDDKVLCAQRSEFMNLPLKWEFPGGKVEAGETNENCILREIEEELGLEISVVQTLPSSIFQYPNAKAICLLPFICRIERGSIHLKEHKQVTWLSLNELKTLDWAAADIPIVDYYLSLRNA